MLEIGPVRTRRDLRAFLRLPELLYRNDPRWVRPLRSERNLAVDTRNHPFYLHSELAMFLAWRDGKPVGRIAAILNRAHNTFHREQTGFFGFYEAEDDPQITAELLATVESWHRDRGMKNLQGPASPSMSAECGTLIEGFDCPPAVLMPYNPPRYAEHLESAGFGKVMDLLAYQLHHSRYDDLRLQRDRLERIVRALQEKKPTLRIRPFDRNNLRRDAFLLRELFDEARRDNFGFVPSTDQEHQMFVGKMKRMLDPELVFILELEGRAVGCLVGIPDWNIALRRSAGTPEPFRLIRLLYERRHIDNLRVIAVGVAEEFRHSGIMSFLLLKIIDAGLAKGYRQAELSWVAEDNTVNIRTLERTFGVKPFKRYRIYGKSLD